MTPRTVYACGSSDYDQRPGTFQKKCRPMTRHRVAINLQELLHRLETEDRPCVTCEHLDALQEAVRVFVGPPVREMTRP